MTTVDKLIKLTGEIGGELTIKYSPTFKGWQVVWKNFKNIQYSSSSKDINEALIAVYELVSAYYATTD